MDIKKKCWFWQHCYHKTTRSGKGGTLVRTPNCEVAIGYTKEYLWSWWDCCHCGKEKLKTLRLSRQV